MVRITPTACERNDETSRFFATRVPSRQRALTLLELIIVMAIVGVLASIAWPSYQHYLDQANIAQAKVDIRIIEGEIERYYLKNNAYPDTLDVIGMGRLRDPWNHLYYYLPITPSTHKGQLRKDRNLVPINSDYDLYSAGKDGATTTPLTAAISRDDVIRASNGRFVGLASDY